MKHRKIVIFSITLLFLTAFLCAGITGNTEAKENRRIITDNDSSACVVLEGATHYRVSLDGKNFSRPMPQRNDIRLRYADFDPLVNLPVRAKTASIAPVNGKKLYIVQCVGQAIVPFQTRITKAGGEICGTLPHNALIVIIPEENVSSVKAMPFVRWMGDYQPIFKLAPEITDRNRTASTGKDRYSLWLAKKKHRTEVENYIKSIGGEVVMKSKGRRMEANLDNGQLAGVSALPWVLYVDPWTPKEDDMDIAREISGANFVETVQGYTGQGVRAEVCDGGLRTTHQDYQANPPIIHAGNSTSTSHGTSVYGHVFGSGAGNATARGVIPDAEQPIFAAYDAFTDRYAHTQELVNPAGNLRGVFQTNSWGNTRTFYYTTISAEMDEIIFDLDVLILQSQSNAGNQDSRPQAWAKNILSVGGLRHYDTLDRSDDCWCTSASIGPADDGRIKPDLCHFYDYTMAPYYTSDTAYANFGGTSGATPITAGHFGLMFQMWADGVFSGGPGMNRDVFNVRPHAATAKALMIHSAYQYPFSGTNHDKTRVKQGWGMPDVKNLYEMAQGANWSFPILIDESAVIAPLETHTYTMTVSGGPLKVTMVYADPAGVPGAAVHRINDLSLKVTSPGGTVYWGNNGLNSGNWSTSGGSSNTIDTVENVFIENPQAGTWTIQVLADEVVQDGHVETPAIDADYALVASGGDSTPVDPPAAPSGLNAAAADCNTINLTWSDNSNNETSFVIERSNNGTSFAQLTSVGSGVTAYSDTSAAENSTYWYRVKAVNSGGDSAYTNIASASTPTCPTTPPNAPSNLSLKARGKNKVVITWNDNSNNETGFRIYRGSSAANLTLLTTVGANTIEYQDDTAASKQTYYYKVCAYNGDGEACTAVQSVTLK